MFSSLFAISRAYGCHLHNNSLLLYLCHLYSLPIYVKPVFTIIPFIYVAYILKKKCTIISFSCGLSNAQIAAIRNEK